MPRLQPKQITTLRSWLILARLSFHSEVWCNFVYKRGVRNRKEGISFPASSFSSS